MKRTPCLLLLLLMAPAFFLALYCQPLAAAQSAQPHTGGVLKIAMAQDITCLGHPLKLRNDETPFVLPWMETLLRMDDQGMVAPNLVKLWEIDQAKNSVILHLQQGVKFHDGTDMDAEAVKFCMVDFRKAVGFPPIVALDSVDVIDKYTLKCNLSRWANTFLYSLTLKDGMIFSPTAFKKNGEDWLLNNPVGTGPFKYAGGEKGISYRFTRFDDCWRGKSKLDGLEYIIITDPVTRLASFMRGEEQIMVNPDVKDIGPLEKSGKYKVFTAPGVMYGLVGDGGNADSPFANIKVRQAMGYAVDTKSIVDNLGYGYWKLCPRNQPTQPGRWADNPSVVGFQYDPHKAKKLLAEAGYPNGVHVTYYAINQPRYIVDFVTAIQGMLAKVGIDAKLELLDSQRWIALMTKTYWKNGLVTLDMTLRNEINVLKTVYAPESTLVKVGTRTPEYQQKLAEVDAAPDPKTTQKLMWELNKMENDKFAQIPWQFMVPNIAVKSLKCHDTFMAGNAFYWDATNAWLEP
jgi:peptide/nickel transport system substrate-binding protein